ncbi:D-alanine--D-alanine ligase B [Oligella ureolytica]|uniref:D-alanine--D-alanine ligase n=1 Tax=Oligella ureolytica TaxID=90244 RepID=A0A378XI30_9BURK|nr:D-alanine--D-alanine ligase [Oligella ureolytica]QPT39510.1 D-alanine--D-alanine ligase [Oligella ureolytica]SUA52969.1 D-alanine--D-alanine ligase B [Oligella ureolytica]SUA56490.1 D-alanine--D-alanine ligase B [Oligella ureolytica]
MANTEINFGKVGVLYGGVSAEREVSLNSGAGVHAALLEKGVDAHLFDMAEHSLGDLEAAKFDRVFIILHGRYGEDGCIQGALEMLGIPYTGPSVMGSSVTMDKIMTKRLLIEQGIPTPNYHVVRNAEDLQEAVAKLGLPMILKPPHEGSTIGLTKIQTADQLEEALAQASQYDKVLLAEQCIVGRELTVAVLGQGEDARALPIIEIVAPDGNYDFHHKYHSDDTQYVCPADLSPEQTKKVQDYCVQAYRTVGCEGWSRVDVMLNANGDPFLLEINTAPGMTSHSLVPMAAKADGMTYPELCVNILASADLKVGRKG